MSLEATIQENTAAVKEQSELLRSLIAKLSAAPIAAQVEAEKVIEKAQTQATKSEAAAKKTTAAATEAAARTQPTAEAGEGAAAAKKAENSAASDKPAPTYQDAAAAITRLSKLKGRDTAVAVLKDFGAATLKDVKPEQFADVIAACEKAEA